jgi:hypothetical protein
LQAQRSGFLPGAHALWQPSALPLAGLSSTEVSGVLLQPGAEGLSKTVIFEQLVFIYDSEDFSPDRECRGECNVIFNVITTEKDLPIPSYICNRRKFFCRKLPV